MIKFIQRRFCQSFTEYGFELHVIDLNYDPAIGLEAAVRNIADQAEEAVRAGRTQIVLTDRHIAPGKLPIHASLATGATVTICMPSDEPVIAAPSTSHPMAPMSAQVGVG